MGVDGDVLVQLVHELPSAFFAHDLDPGIDRLVTGAGRCRVGHHDAVFVDWVGKVHPSRWLRHVLFATLDGVVAHHRQPSVHTGPAHRRFVASECGFDLVSALGGVGLQHVHRVKQRHAGGAQAPDHIGAGVVFFSQQARSNDPGGVPYPGDFNIWVVGFKGLFVGADLVGLEGAVDGDSGFLRQGRCCDERRHHQGRGAQHQFAGACFEH